MIRTIMRMAYRLLWSLCFTLPIDSKKAVVVSYFGRGYSDNPKYVADKLHDLIPTLNIYWAVSSDDYAADLPSFVTPIKYKSITYVYHMVTAKLWIDNSRKDIAETKRKEQLYVQLWHGSNAIIKKVEKDAEDKLSNAYTCRAKKDASQTDLMIAGSAFGKDRFRQAFYYPTGEVLEAGTPRNDIFFDDTKTADRKVRDRLRIDKNTKVLLYAPTFRSNHSLDTYFLDFKKIIDSFNARFGGTWVVALRLHPNVAKESKKLGVDKLDNVIDATQYDDMQELLVASDALLTDYSSSVFDFILTKRPIFILATDHDEYVAERGVYFNLKTLPFPYSESVEKLIINVSSFSERSYRSRCNDFIKRHVFYDNGTASLQTAKWIKKHM